MDTIHTLNTSLPTSTARSQDPPRSNHQRQPLNTTNASHHQSASTIKAPPPNLHAAFKAAAFSVAQLYKTAATDSDSSRAEGYQDAIDELLAFLDQENLGLGDGEGWRVRQWATERLEPSIYGAGNSDADDEHMKEEQSHKTEAGGVSSKTADDLSTSTTKEPAHDSNEQGPRSTATDDSNSSSPATTDAASSITPTSSSDKPDMFRFTSNPYAHDMDMTHDDAPFNFNAPSLRSGSPTSLRVNLRPHRHGNSTTSGGGGPNAASRGRSGHAASMSLGSLGLGAGSKRKSPPTFADFFDLGAFGGGGGGGAGGGGGKRGRME